VIDPVVIALDNHVALEPERPLEPIDRRTFSCDIAYSRSPAASRASCFVW